MTPFSGPENTENYEKGPNMFWAIFESFLYFFLNFRSPTRLGEFAFIFIIFSVSTALLLNEVSEKSREI